MADDGEARKEVNGKGSGSGTSSNGLSGAVPEAVAAMGAEAGSHPPPVLMNEAQLVLADKRTSLATLRTGIAILVLPMSVLSLLIATSKYYSIKSVLNLLIPLSALNVGLIGLAAYLIWRALRNIHHQDRVLKRLKSRHPGLAEFLD